MQHDSCACHLRHESLPGSYAFLRKHHEHAHAILRADLFPFAESARRVCHWRLCDGDAVTRCGTHDLRLDAKSIFVEVRKNCRECVAREQLRAALHVAHAHTSHDVACEGEQAVRETVQSSMRGRWNTRSPSIAEGESCGCVALLCEHACPISGVVFRIRVVDHNEIVCVHATKHFGESSADRCAFASVAFMHE